MATRRERVTWALVGFAAAGVIAAMVVIVVSLVGSDGEDPPSATSPARSSTTVPARPGGEDSTRPAEPGTTDHTMQEGLFQRQYLVIAPDQRNDDERLPVVMVLHGLGVDRFGIAAAADWEGAVDEHRFIAVFPQGVTNSWNAGPCCPPSNLLQIDDVAFLDRVLAEVRARPDVDDERTYLTGFSNGGIMVYTEACARPSEFRAIASIAGVNLSGCSPTEPIPLLHLHGDPDPVVPYDGGFTPSQLIASADIPPIPDSVAAWARSEGCRADSQVESDGIERRRWSSCDGDVTAELVTYPGNRHAWPTDPVDGLTELLRFFDLD